MHEPGTNPQIKITTNARTQFKKPIWFQSITDLEKVTGGINKTILNEKIKHKFRCKK